MQEQPFLKLLPLDWQFFSAISTFLAVAVALFLPFYLNRRKLKITSMLSFMATQSYQSETGLSATVTNMGRNKITITNWGLKFFKKSGKKYATINPGISPEIPIRLPVTLEYMDYYTLFGPIPKDIDDIKNIFVIDSSGKYWYLKRKEMKKLRKEIENYNKERK